MLEDKIVVLDFHSTCFLPESFIDYAMRWPGFTKFTEFARKVAKYVNYPQSSNFEAMVTASYYLVCYGRNDIGQPDSFRFT